jgi:glycerate kinase
MRVLIVPDKFKGTLTAHAAAAAIARGWRSSRPGDHLEVLPMSDGGDGFGAVNSAILGARTQTVHTVDAAHRPCAASWWWEPKSKTAIIESAGIIGLAQLPPGKFHPFQLDTFGLGAVIRAAAAKGAWRCLVGIGGSATNDAGFGLARALGWEFRDRAGNAITSWTGLHALAKIIPPVRRRWFAETVVAVDVQNPLLGRQGCTRIYGPQKGIKPREFGVAEKNLRRLAAVAQKQFHRDYAAQAGVGAAGGLGFGFRCFLGATLQPGFDLFARQAGLAQRLRAADLVITGEGALDQSSLMGKGVGEVARLCKKSDVPCLGLAGTVLAPGRASKYFVQAHGLTDLTSARQAKAKPAFWLERLSQKIARDWKP